MTHDYKEYREPDPPDPEWFRKLCAFLGDNWIAIMFVLWLSFCFYGAITPDHRSDDYLDYDRTH